MLDYHKLHVYQASLAFLELAVQAIGGLPRGHAALADQLRRAAMSIPLNIAEASGKTSRVDRAHFHSIARGSAMECGAILDVMALMNLTSQKSATDGHQLLERIVSMLSKLARP
jgi:four helix bundle protein